MPIAKEDSMAQNTPVEMVKSASTVSILWGALLIVLGVMAVGSPFLAAVAVNVVVAWLILFAGVVHLALAFRAHGAGSMIWKVLVGIAYLCFGAYLLVHPVLAVATLTLLLASLFLIEGILDIVLYVKMRSDTRIELGADRRDRYAAAGTDDLHAVAVEFGVGDRHRWWASA
jgi:uncharacterized membrane protein HdeD (DUF308 family)